MFSEVSVLLLLVSVVGAVALRLRQPLIVAFIAVGVMVGPSGFGWVRSFEQLHLLAELGLAILLFVVGLRLDLGLIRSTGPVALATGLGQVLFTSVLGYFIALALGMDHITSIYVAVALTFSSTIIIVKLLSDKRETDALHGRIAIGLLIVQDILVVLAMIGLTAFGGQSGTVDLGLQALLIAAKGAALLAGLGLLMLLVLPRLLSWLAHSAELLVLFAVAWAALVASLSGSLGFSKEVGAFLAGVSLASTNCRDILGAKLVSLRDFLLLFFFIDLGIRLDLGLLGAQVWAAIPLSIFVLVGNPLIVMIIMDLMGYRKRTSFLTGLTVAQISEFSLILAALGLKLGHIDASAVGLVTLVGMVTIGLSTYMILYSGVLYDRLSPFLSVFERRIPHREQAGDTEHEIADQADVIVFGLGRYGTAIASHLIARGRSVLGIDFDPQAVRKWNALGRPAWFGDAEDPEFPSALPLSSARWVVSSVRDESINRALIHNLREHNFTRNIAVTAGSASESKSLADAGADVVFFPFTDAASEAVDNLILAEQQEARRKMDKIIAGLKDHYIVCGYGRMGKQIVSDFERYSVPHVVIEWNPEQLPRLIERNVPHIEGKATEDEVLIKAGVQRARGLIAVTATDEENVFIVLTARGLNPGLYIVARSILQDNEDKLRRAGADRVMSPYVLGGRQMATAVLKPRVMDFLDLVLHQSESNLEIADLVVCESAEFANRTIAESAIRNRIGINVLAVKSADGSIHTNPGPDTVLRAGDELIVFGTREQIDSLERICGA